MEPQPAAPQTQNWGGSYMPDRTDAGIMGAFDATDVIEEIRHNLRRNEIVDGEDEKKHWKKPQPEYGTFQASKQHIENKYGDIQNFINDVNSHGGQILETKGDIITFSQITRPAPLPLVNTIGEHDLMNLLTAFLNKNIYFSAFPGRGNDMFVYRLVNKFSQDLIRIIGINAKKYEIQEPQHLTIILYIIVPNVFAALQQAVDAGGRTTLKDVLGEKKIITEQIQTTQK